MNNKTILRAIFDILPLAIAVIPWGILAGAISIQVGLSSWEAQALSMFVYAGAAQLSAITLFGTGAGLFAISSSVFVISSRHILYSLDFRNDIIILPLRWRVAIAFFLTDEMYVVTKNYMKEKGSFCKYYAITSGITFYVLWNISTFIGIQLANTVSNIDSLGLDFAIVTIFIAMTIKNLQNSSMFIVTFSSAILSIVLKDIFPNNYILVASLISMFIGYIHHKRFNDEY